MIFDLIYLTCRRDVLGERMELPAHTLQFAKSVNRLVYEAVALDVLKQQSIKG